MRYNKATIMSIYARLRTIMAAYDIRGLSRMLLFPTAYTDIWMIAQNVASRGRIENGVKCFVPWEKDMSKHVKREQCGLFITVISFSFSSRSRRSISGMSRSLILKKAISTYRFLHRQFVSHFHGGPRQRATEQTRVYWTITRTKFLTADVRFT